MGRALDEIDETRSGKGRGGEQREREREWDKRCQLRQTLGVILQTQTLDVRQPPPTAGSVWESETEVENCKKPEKDSRFYISVRGWVPVLEAGCRGWTLSLSLWVYIPDTR